MSAGFAYLDVARFASTNFLPQGTSTSGSAFNVGASTGAQLGYFGLGARTSYARGAELEFTTLGVDLRVTIPVSALMPYLRAGIGYGWVRRVGADVGGLYGDLGTGIKVKVAETVSVGAGLDVAFLDLTRRAVRDGGAAPGVDLTRGGSARGLQVRAHADLTLHL